MEPSYQLIPHFGRRLAFLTTYTAELTTRGDFRTMSAFAHVARRAAFGSDARRGGSKVWKPGQSLAGSRRATRGGGKQTLV